MSTTTGWSGAPRTVLEVLERNVRELGDRPAMRFRDGDGNWQAITWAEYGRGVDQVARGLIELGLEPGGGVAILASNRPEWFLASIGAIAAGGVPAGIYTTSTEEQCAYVARHCEAAVAVVENEERLAPFIEHRDQLPALKAIVLLDGAAGAPGVLGWSELLERGAAADGGEARRRRAALAPGDRCTLIYTSGTTGRPKGVMLSHHNLTWTAETVCREFGLHGAGAVLSYLPLCHVAEQVIGLHGPMEAGACTWFARSLETVGRDLLDVRPQVFVAVPRVWEKIQQRIAAAAAASPAPRRWLLAWARRQGRAGAYADQRGERRPTLYPLAERLVFARAKERLGLDQALLCVTSAAPIGHETLEFFLGLGIPLLEVYGMSECTGPGTFSLPDRYRTGRAGFAVPGTELRIADDGEILMRGPHVFLGYFNDSEATSETLDAEGWLHSGDVGELDDEGFLKVTDRKKELIITSGGKNVAPQPIESRLRAIPGVATAAVVGDRRNYLAALLTLDPESLPAAAAAAGSPATDIAAAGRCPQFRAFLEERVDAVNATLARFETIKRFAVLDAVFSVEGGELTPTLKLKRRVVAEKYAAQIDALYS